ncbi:hypothetical protein QOZ80_8BG0662330 [Eleusine coracana subsp. coracana]|nr:hypothetical protein QOZ80_8BG0662330 [Eleusine coracana subsp. coracana]
MAPNCTATLQLHGPSRLSRSACSTPIFTVDDVKSTAAFTDEEFHELMRGGERETPSRSGSDELVQCHFQAARFSIDDILQAPLSEDDAVTLAEIFSEEEIEAILAGGQQPPADGRQKAAKKRKRRPPFRRPSSSSDAAAAAGSVAMVPRRPAKKARLVRSWHKQIASRILACQFRAPEPSRGRTTLRCQCSELAAMDDRACALHQDAGDGGEEWTEKVRRRVPMAAGPGHVRVPRLARKNSIAEVTRYMRWRRGVWMPTRFYLERAAERSVDAWLNRNS